MAKTLSENEHVLVDIFAQQLNPSPKYRKLTDS